MTDEEKYIGIVISRLTCVADHVDVKRTNHGIRFHIRNGKKELDFLKPYIDLRMGKFVESISVQEACSLISAIGGESR